ncbi:uncharacterized protein LOC119555091 [Drosophila subpulchrella]|uniref:uncharacterized protein LOC119555091 n=1 Tax=Drosophila subpulchrella TaxID=1486046 RepID=UPI0018A15B2C|nr:uncharacterized protein LOC119555091 [Drosophila subpulchrella]
MPPPNSSGVVKTRRLPTEYKVTDQPMVRRSVSKAAVDIEEPPIVALDSLDDPNHDDDLPTSEDIWQTFKDLKKALVPQSEADWPLCCMVGMENSKSPPPTALECLNSQEASLKIVSQENNAADGLIDWEIDSKSVNNSQQRRIFYDGEIVFDKITIGEEEDQALDDWIKAEGLNEPYSDIDEFDMLLSLAREQEKNRKVLFDLLKPKNLQSTQAKDVKKRSSMVFEELPSKIDAVEPQFRKTVPDEMMLETIPEDDISEIYIEESFKEMQLIELRPERPIILDVKNIGSVPPKAQDEAAIQDWLQQCSSTISQHLQFLINEESVKPTSTEPGAIDFESEIDNEQMKPRSSGKCIIMSPPKNEWQNSFTGHLEDFEDIIDHSMTEYRDPQAKRLRSKWKQQYGFKSAEQLGRTLVLPPLPVHPEQCLQKIKILRRPTKRQSEFLSLPVKMHFCKLFCTLQLNRNLDLDMAVRTLDNAVYNRDIGVIEVRYEATQIGWIWGNGTVMIINGRSNAMLAETQSDIVAKTMGKVNFKPDPSHKLLNLRLFSSANYPWTVDLQEFSAVHSLSSEPFLREKKFVYYVNEDMPGVSARLYESGMIQVFAMTTAEADEMLKKLYLLLSSYRNAEIKNNQKH